MFRSHLHCLNLWESGFRTSDSRRTRTMYRTSLGTRVCVIRRRKVISRPLWEKQRPLPFPGSLVMCAPPFPRARTHWLALWERCWERILTFRGSLLHETETRWDTPHHIASHRRHSWGAFSHMTSEGAFSLFLMFYRECFFFLFVLC